METQTKEHYIVGIGGSAGSIDPLKSFLDHTPLDSVSYIVIRHLPKESQSQLKYLLKNHSILQVVDATEGMPLDPNTVYIGPAHKHVVIKDRKLHLVERSDGPNYAIDLFFHSLAAAGYKHRAIAVILSGGGFDGTKGAEAVREAGGLVIVQNPETTQFDSMPNYSIREGVADRILVPAEMPAFIQQYVQAHLRGK